MLGDQLVLITALDRVGLLAVLPKGGTVAEVGTLRGGFAKRIRSTAEPEKLHLIDPWGRDEEPNPQYGADLMHDAYEKVQGIFRDDVAAGRVVLHRDFSTRVAPAFPDHHFDWVYIDGQHDYDNVRADLLAFKDKVKPDGFILGHDFSTYKRRFGVVPAVREFIKAEGFELVLVTNETNPSYLLARSDNATTLPALRDALLNHPGGRPIEIDETLLDGYEQVPVVHADGTEGWLMRFGWGASEAFPTPPARRPEGRQGRLRNRSGGRRRRRDQPVAEAFAVTLEASDTVEQREGREGQDVKERGLP